MPIQRLISFLLIVSYLREFEFSLTFRSVHTHDHYSMIRDKKLLGVCGETELANAKQSIITMMQVSAEH
jgi:hypothetical protein